MEAHPAFCSLCDAESAIGAALLAIDGRPSHLRLLEPGDSVDPDEISF